MKMRTHKRRRTLQVAQRWAGRWELRRFCRWYAATLPRVSPRLEG